MGREQGTLGVWARLTDSYQEAGMGLGQVASNREKTGVFLVSNRAAVKMIEQQHTVRYSVSGGGGGGTTHWIYGDFAFAYLCLPIEQ